LTTIAEIYCCSNAFIPRLDIAIELPAGFLAFVIRSLKTCEHLTFLYVLLLVPKRFRGI
jgi:hypothetical protein